jgi:hypothetical protein
MSNGEHRASDASEWPGLMHGMLDGTLDDAARARFAAEVAADPARATDFARMAMLHDAIEREMTAGAVGRSTARRTRWMLSVQRAAAAVAIAAAVGVLAFVGLRGSDANAAHAELARIASMSPAGQRTYVIHALRDDGRPRGREQRRAEPPSPRGAARVRVVRRTERLLHHLLFGTQPHRDEHRERHQKRRPRDPVRHHQRLTEAVQQQRHVAP